MKSGRVLFFYHGDFTFCQRAKPNWCQYIKKNKLPRFLHPHTSFLRWYSWKQMSNFSSIRFIFHYSVKHLALLFLLNVNEAFGDQWKCWVMKPNASALISTEQEQKPAISQSTIKDFEIQMNCANTDMLPCDVIYQSICLLQRRHQHQIRCLDLSRSQTQDGDPPTVRVSWWHLKVTKTLKLQMKDLSKRILYLLYKRERVIRNLPIGKML